MKRFPLQRFSSLPRPALQLPGGAGLWVILASAGFLLAAFAANARQLLQLSLDAQGWCWLLLGVGVSLLSLVVNGAAWAMALGWLGHQPRWAVVLQLFLASNLRKYLPGGVWHLLARLQALRAPAAGAGVQPAPLTHPLATAPALVAVLLDPVLMAVAALALVPFGGWQAGFGLLAPLALLLLLPRWLNPLLVALERRRERQLRQRGLLVADDAPVPPLQLPGYPWPPLLLELAFVLLRFLGFACCVQAFDLAYALSWGSWLAGFALAWTAGLVVPGAPGGLGVFEAVLLLRLSVAVPEAPLLALAISYRLITALADLLAAGTAQVDAIRNRHYC
jgi:uncharacterized membrane protein YbhN (UPF0104 family)